MSGKTGAETDRAEQDFEARTLAQRIDRTLRSDRLFAMLPDGPLETGELARRMRSMAAALTACGAPPDDRIAVLARSDRVVIATVAACLRLGRPVLVCDPEASVEETRSLLAHCRPAVLVADTPEGLALGSGLGPAILDGNTLTEDAGDPMPAIAPQDVALLVHTSGTTSRPKVVELSHANLAAQFQIFETVYGFDAASRLMNLLPMHHVDGLVRGPLSALWFDATLLRPRRFSVQAVPTLLSELASLAATHLIAVPALLRILHRVGGASAGRMGGVDFRYVLCSADHLDATLWAAVERDFGVPVVNAYGLSEVVCDALMAGPDDATRVIGTIGAARGVSASIVGPDGRPLPDGETGELVIAGGTVMRGYLGDADATAEVLRDGRFHTGDLARRRQDGLFEFVGRKKTAVVVGGVTIHPESVAEALGAIAGVAEAYAFGEGAPAGEKLVAVVCPAEGATLDLETVWQECRARLAPERRPERIAILPALPRRASGKVDRDALVAALDERGAKEADTGLSVFEIAARCFNHPVDALSEYSSPFDTPGWDSLAHMNFIETLETQFSFVMTPEDIAGLMTLGDALEIVEREIA